MRGKEEALDYRYFPEPDLLPVTVDEDGSKRCGRRCRTPHGEDGTLHERLRLPRYDVEILSSDRELAAYFEEVLKLFPEAKTVSNFIMTELLRN
jgi:aspartyl-tRNA(Asn)/glutamyl-tRNA(Gln) amidotransferase subunit B